jgi:hypothetical protein
MRSIMDNSPYVLRSGVEYGDKPVRAALSAAAAQPAAEARLPHRRLELDALRQLGRGHYLVVDGDTARAIRLAGIRKAAHLADDFVARGLVEPVAVPDLGATCYTLSAAGRDALRHAEQWWRKLTLMQRLKVRFTG